MKIKVVFQDCGTGSGSFIFKYKLFEYTIINEFYRWTEKAAHTSRGSTFLLTTECKSDASQRPF